MKALQERVEPARGTGEPGWQAVFQRVQDLLGVGLQGLHPDLHALGEARGKHGRPHPREHRAVVLELARAHHGEQLVGRDAVGVGPAGAGIGAVGRHEHPQGLAPAERPPVEQV